MKLNSEFRRISKLLLISFSAILILTGCELIDEKFGTDYNKDPDSQQDDISDVIDIQDDAGIIMDNLFDSGADTVSVKDSLAAYFRQDNSVKEVWVSSQGVAVEYESGIRGGIFMAPVDYTKGMPLKEQTKMINGKEKKSGKNVVPLISPKKTIFLGAADSQFDEEPTLINPSNASFGNVGLESYATKLDNDAVLSYYKELDQYGIIHLSGHGWAWPKNPKHKDFKEVYLLTGQKVTNDDIANNKYTYDQAKEQLLVASFSYSKGKNKYKQNRIWISPKYISDNNSFNPDSSVVYGSFCYSQCGSWSNEIYKNAKAGLYIGYEWSLKSSWDVRWVNSFFNDLCNTTLSEPKKAGEWMEDLISYYIDDKGNFVSICYDGSSDFAFWKEEEVLDFNRVNFVYNLELKWDDDCTQSGGPFPWRWSSDGSGHDGINLKLNKSGKTYSGSWNVHTPYNPGWTNTGSINFTLSDQENTEQPGGGWTNIANTVEFTIRWEGDDAPKDIFGWTFHLSNVEYKLSSNGDISFGIRGLETCNHISYFEYEQSCHMYPNGGFHYITNYRCDGNENAQLYLSIDNH